MTQAKPEPIYKTACDDKLTDPINYPCAMYRGGRVYFCTDACLHAFEQGPNLFMAGDVEHPTKED